MAPGFSTTLRERYTKKWGKMGGSGSGNLLNQRRPIADGEVDFKTTPTSFPTKRTKCKSKKSKNKSKTRKSTKTKKSKKRKRRRK